MGLFDMFRSKSPSDTMQDEMKRLAPILFPGGHEEIQRTGRSISGLLDNRIPADAAARLFASTKYLAHTAKDQSKPRVVEYIIRQGMGRISETEASAIYDRFILGVQAAPEATSARSDGSGAMFIDESLSGRKYRLQNSFRTVEVDAALFTVMLLGVKGQGWQGARELFTPDGSTMKPLVGSYAISDRDARELAASLQQLVSARGLDHDSESMIRPLISIASQGSFTLHT